MSVVRIFVLGAACSAVGALLMSAVLAGTGIAPVPWFSSALGAAIGSGLGWAATQTRLGRQ